MRKNNKTPLWTCVAFLAFALTLGGCSDKNHSSPGNLEIADAPLVVDPAALNIVETAMDAATLKP